LEGVRWTHWGRNAARGTVRWRYRTYMPYEQLRLRLYRPKRCYWPPSPAIGNQSIRMRLFTRARVNGDMHDLLPGTDPDHVTPDDWVRTGTWFHTWRLPGCNLIHVT
jgi:hypothetical protein